MNRTQPVVLQQAGTVSERVTTIMNEAAAVREADLHHLWHPWSPLDAGQERLVLTDGYGCQVRDTRGRTFLDLRAGTLNATVGYSHPDVVQALHEQAGRLMTWDLAEVTTPPAAWLARRIASLLPPPLGRTLFCNSGSEATEAALKIARMWHRIEGCAERKIVLSYADGYHGATAAAIAATASEFRREGSGPLPSGYAHLVTPRCSACASAVGHAACQVPGTAEWEEQILTVGPENIAAVLVEPVLSVGGVIVPPPGRLRDLRALCDRYGMLLIVDEVATGFGRTGKLFGFEHDLDGQAAPDIVTTSKGLTGGYAPLAAVTVREDIYSGFARDPLLGGLRHGHTTGGHATACAAALAVLDVIERDCLVAAAAERGTQLLTSLQALSEYAGVRGVRGRGLMIGVEMASIELAAQVARAAQDDGVLVRSFGPVLTVAPPLTISADEARMGAEVLTEAVRATTTAVVAS
ncbi:aminotransferase family protein [Streptomyces sp. NPDC002817]|uniref:aminotransferase family protein n=1 Tax=Streptomyces sp. NPDC088357 TaxID=3154655 RepID=UPI0034496F47